MKDLSFTEYVTDTTTYSDVSLETFHIKDHDDLENFLTDNLNRIIDLIFDSIVYGLKEGLIRTPAFNLRAGLDLVTITIPRDNFDLALKKCIEHYEIIENYEKCGIALRLIKDQESQICKYN